MISLYLGWNGCIRGSIPLASHCLSNTKNRKIDFKWLEHTFSTTDKLTDLVQTNPANLRKKDVKNPLSY
jgi:hypothetical protein